MLLISLGYGLHRGQHYYGNTQYWCWITSGWGKERIALEYVWMWFTAFVNFLLYIPLFWCLRGNLTVIGWRWRWRWRKDGEQPGATLMVDDAQNSMTVARQMLWCVFSVLLCLFNI